VIVDLSDLDVVDGHCHPLLPDPWAVSPAALLDRFSEGRPGAMAAHVPHTGYYRRAMRALAALYRVEPTPEAILARRRAAGPETARRLLVERRVAALLVDTGYPPQAMALATMRGLMPCSIHEVFRIERCAEALLARALPYAEFLEAFRRELRTAAERCVGLKTIIAYRSGLAIRTWDPGEIGDAYRRALAHGQAGGGWRLTDKPLTDSLFAEALQVAGATGRPLQVHTGFGDPDIDLLQANPLLLRPILEDPAHAGVRLVLLHMAYPYCREAAFMAALWPQVFVDLSEMPVFLGPGSIPPLLEILALAPASKLLYGSDVGALPELFALAAEWTRAALGEALGWLVARGELTSDEARGAARRILSENALALYGLPPGAG
jgi:predicted TIM-barrel fold metal-dependent hydrolase